MELFADIHQLRQESLDAPGAVPTDHIGRNLIANAVGKHTVEAASTTRGAGDRFAGFSAVCHTVQKAQMLRPGHINEHPYSLAG
jgi:hypothetical protein